MDEAVEGGEARSQRRTKAGRLVSSITLEELQSCFHMPSEQACKHLGVGLTILKRVCRRFGIPRWPYSRAGKHMHYLQDDMDSSGMLGDGSVYAAGMNGFNGGPVNHMQRYQPANLGLMEPGPPMRQYAMPMQRQHADPDFPPMHQDAPLPYQSTAPASAFQPLLQQPGAASQAPSQAQPSASLRALLGGLEAGLLGAVQQSQWSGHSELTQAGQQQQQQAAAAIQQLAALLQQQPQQAQQQQDYGGEDTTVGEGAATTLQNLNLPTDSLLSVLTEAAAAAGTQSLAPPQAALPSHHQLNIMNNNNGAGTGAQAPSLDELVAAVSRSLAEGHAANGAATPSPVVGAVPIPAAPDATAAPTSGSAGGTQASVRQTMPAGGEQPPVAEQRNAGQLAQHDHPAGEARVGQAGTASAFQATGAPTLAQQQQQQALAPAMRAGDPQLECRQQQPAPSSSFQPPLPGDSSSTTQELEQLLLQALPDLSQTRALLRKASEQLQAHLLAQRLLKDQASSLSVQLPGSCQLLAVNAELAELCTSTLLSLLSGSSDSDVAMPGP